MGRGILNLCLVFRGGRDLAGASGSAMREEEERGS